MKQLTYEEIRSWYLRSIERLRSEGQFATAERVAWYLRQMDSIMEEK